jgi:hypothetical protein
MLELDGLSLAEHRRRFPKRWKVKHRAWPVFWWSFGVIPVFVGVNALFGTEWERYDTGFCIGYIIAKLMVAIYPKDIEADTTATWTLDPKPSFWSRITRKAQTHD